MQISGSVLTVYQLVISDKALEETLGFQINGLVLIW